MARDSIRRSLLPLLVGGSLLVGGCAAGIAASAVGMAARAARGEPESNEHLQPEARQACTAHAGQHGAVHIIDVEQRSVDEIRVWGTVEREGERKSFQCDFGTEITGFKLREIRRR